MTDMLRCMLTVLVLQSCVRMSVRACIHACVCVYVTRLIVATNGGHM